MCDFLFYLFIFCGGSALDLIKLRYCQNSALLKCLSTSIYVRRNVHGNEYHSRMVLHKVGILTLLRNSGMAAFQF